MILWALVAVLAIAFVAMWVLGGGFSFISAAIPHYRDPLKFHSVIEYFFQAGSSTGESFKLPGTPSVYPRVNIVHNATSTTSYGPTTIYETGSTGGQGMQ